jgi:hypothetical protein
VYVLLSRAYKILTVTVHSYNVCLIVYLKYYFRSESDRDQYLKALARDNTQLLLNCIWELPTERVEEAIVAKLPAPTFVLPREKPLPKPKPLTKWQKYAQEKGITKTKKLKLTWDETLQVSSGIIFSHFSAGLFCNVNMFLLNITLACAYCLTCRYIRL